MEGVDEVVGEPGPALLTLGEGNLRQGRVRGRAKQAPRGEGGDREAQGGGEGLLGPPSSG